MKSKKTESSFEQQRAAVYVYDKLPAFEPDVRAAIATALVEVATMRDWSQRKSQSAPDPDRLTEIAMQLFNGPLEQTGDAS